MDIDLKNDFISEEYIKQYIEKLDSGIVTCVQKNNGSWEVNTEAKKMILEYFKVMKSQDIGFDKFNWVDKIPLKKITKEMNIRVVPPASIRYGSYIEQGAIIMPSFINIGARVGAGTMIDTWSTVGSCAYVGKNCHISGGVGIGGVLEPIGAVPVIIEDNCFIGARSEIAEGVIVEEGCVISMGVFIGASTKIIDRESGEVFYGRVPTGSVVVPGSYKSKGDININCAVIVKKVDIKTKSKTEINEILRMF